MEGGGRGLRAFLTPFNVIGHFVKLQVGHLKKNLHSTFTIFLCDSYGSVDKPRLLLCTAITGRLGSGHSIVFKVH